jgi:hypothetical protein
MNYVDVPWSQGSAWDNSGVDPTIYLAGLTPKNAATLLRVTMTDNNDQPISRATIEGPQFLWFHNMGSSCGAVICE